MFTKRFDFIFCSIEIDWIIRLRCNSTFFFFLFREAENIKKSTWWEHNVNQMKKKCYSWPMNCILITITFICTCHHRAMARAILSVSITFFLYFFSLSKSKTKFEWKELLENSFAHWIAAQQSFEFIVFIFSSQKKKDKFIQLTVLVSWDMAFNSYFLYFYEANLCHKRRRKTKSHF